MKTYQYLFTYEVKGSQKNCEELELSLLMYLSGISVLNGLKFYTEHSVFFRSQENINSINEFFLTKYAVIEEKSCKFQYAIFNITEETEIRSFSNADSDF